MKTLVLYTVAPSTPASGRDSGEFDLSEAAQAVAQALPAATSLGIRGDAREVLALIDSHRPDVVFNACEAPLGRPDLEAHVAALLEWLGVRFTGCGSETLALCRRKDRVSAVLAQAGIAVPRPDGFPCIVKPADEDGSAGIEADCYCADAEAVTRVRARLSGRVVVQAFMPGREFAVALWGRREPEHAGIRETLFTGELRLNTYAAKWQPSSGDFASTPWSYEPSLEPALRRDLVGIARSVWCAVGARGYLTVDVRLDEAGVPHVLDVNPNPELAPDGMYAAVAAAGWAWEDFVRRQVEWA
jgi:D-alanine-D-alanine ligase